MLLKNIFNGHGSYRSIAKTLETDCKAIQKWVSQYEAHSVELRLN